jgi:hypothetical protein
MNDADRQFRMEGCFGIPQNFAFIVREKDCEKVQQSDIKGVSPHN